MSTEYAGITIIIDYGPKRTVVNIPRAEAVDLRVIEDMPQLLAADPCCELPLSIKPPLIRHTWRPIGEYTLREEENPWHQPAPQLSERERAEAERFGIHDEDDRGGVW
ncbi:hypothetical protein D8M34_06025 [Microbacterium sp. HSID17254]|uniref:hypothetical protein n=1 Tax=Microbacterium sp. HSID17254 TaxID=2419509 RepID=UPI000F868637|nr:hypothetical protein [Microbacterium sp. HSID17254]RUQ07026.1 hypothetical protein D8M34_06025 [Microbacterium sp. HSID17254]